MMTKPKLLVIGKYYGPDQGGIENHSYHLAHGLKKYFEVTFLAYNKSRSSEKYIDKGINVIKAGSSIILKSQPVSIKYIFHLLKHCFQADVIHIHSPNPLAEIWLLKKKNIVVTYHSDIVRQKVLYFFYRPFQQMLFKNARKIIATSPNMAKNSSAISSFNNKTEIIPLCFTKIFQKNKSNLSLSKLKKPIVLFVGRLVRYKGVEILLQASKLCPEHSLVIVGDGPEKFSLMKYAKKMTHVHFIGSKSGSDLTKCYSECDFLVLPSINRTESFGIVVLEAMYFAKPVITTELGTGTSFVNIHKKTGYVIPPNDVQSLYVAMSSLIKSPKLRKKMGSYARQRVLRNFTWGQSIISHKRILQKARK